MKRIIKIITIITIITILMTPQVKAITSDQVIYGSDKTVTEALDELNMCATSGDATAGDILSGKTAYVQGKLVTGTIPTLATAGCNNTECTTGHADATMTSYGVKSSNDSTSYLYLGLPKNTYTGNNAFLRASANEVATAIGLTGAKLIPGNTVLGVSSTVANKGTATYNPGTTNQTINAGQYLSGAQTIKGDANLKAENIKSGTSIFGVSGTYTSDATATAADIAKGKTAYVKGQKVTGTREHNVYVLDQVQVTSITKNGSTLTPKANTWTSLLSSWDVNTVFSVELPITFPTGAKCRLQLSNNGMGSNYGVHFRQTMGYASNSTTVQYTYPYYIYSENYQDTNPNASTNWARIHTYCRVDGSKVTFSIVREKEGTPATALPSLDGYGDIYYLDGYIAYD